MIEHAVDGLLFLGAAVLILTAIGIVAVLGRLLLDVVAWLVEVALDKWRKPPPT